MALTRQVSMLKNSKFAKSALAFCSLIASLLFPKPLFAHSLPTEPVQALGVCKVYIWGEVKSPGAYQLSGAPDIIELISTAGGPTQNADLTKVILIKGTNGTAERINLNKRLGRKNQKQGLFFLASGDVVLVPTSFWAKLRQNLPLITTLAIFANLALTITQAQKQ